VWRTDEPCPTCGAGLFLLDDGSGILRWECRMCGDRPDGPPRETEVIGDPAGDTGTAQDGKAHRREYLGYAGRRVLVSRKWSGKTLPDHRGDRRAWLMDTLGIPAADPGRYSWEPVSPGDPDHMPPAQRMLHVVADRIRWRDALAEARRRAGANGPPDLSATGRAA